MRTICNVFVPFKGNQLQLAQVHFDQTVQKIEIVLPQPVAWSEIASLHARQKFLQRIASRLPPVKKDDIDGQFLLLMPGAIDPHVHFDTPGFEFREDFEHASRAALWGGVTTIIDMPCTSLPPVTSPANLQRKLQALKNRAFCDYALWGGIAGNDFNDPQQLQKNVNALIEAGVVGFKAYLISGMETFTDLDAQQMLQAAQWTKAAGVPLAVHAEDKALVVGRRQQLQAAGQNDWRAYCRARDVQAEDTAVQQMVEIAQQTDALVHIVHLSSRNALQRIRRAQQHGLPITTETCPHYLFFTQNDFERPDIRNFLKTAPPVKFEEDRAALWQGLSDGTIRFVTTDHAGCNPQEEKTSENFWQVYGGIPGVEHRVTFLFSEGFLKGRLSLEQTVDLLSARVADFFNLKSKGRLQSGKDADFALIDLWTEWTVRAEAMHSKGRYTPFEGQLFKARVQKTFLRGQLVANAEDDFLSPVPTGRWLLRG